MSLHCFMSVVVKIKYYDHYPDSTLILTAIAMKTCMDIGARPRVWSFVMFLMFVNSRRWFVLRLVCIPYLVLVLVSGDRDQLC
jgi:hypothetical protein